MDNKNCQAKLRIGYFYLVPEPKTVVTELYEADDKTCRPITSSRQHEPWKLLYSEPYTHEYCNRVGIDLSTDYAIQPKYFDS